MKFVVKWGVYYKEHKDLIGASTNHKEEFFDTYEEAKRYRDGIICDCIRLGTSFYTHPIIEVRD